MDDVAQDHVEDIIMSKKCDVDGLTLWNINYCH
jgi:hypothetical protein